MSRSRRQRRCEPGELGWNVIIDHSCDDWDAKDAADYLLGRLEELRREGREPVSSLAVR